jgi:Ca-activated chloride channel family protein
MNAKMNMVIVLMLSLMLAACGTSTPTTTVMGSFSKPAAATAAAVEAPVSRGAVQPTAVSSYPQQRSTPTAAAWPTEGRAPTATALPKGEGSQPNINPYVETSVDHLSTFALDVDTASYTRARAELMAGRMPAPDSVRVEEFVNYFKQDYPTPPDVAFAVYADGAPSPFHSDGSTLLRIGVQGYRVPDEMRKPLVLTFVIDVSGSMGEDGKLEMVKQTLVLLAQQLRSTDTVSIVVYSTDAWVVLYPTRGDQYEQIAGAIYSLSPLYTTNVEAGLRLGYQIAASAYRADASNRVILCSDGVANEGITNADGILAYVHGYTEMGITLTAIGVGMGNYNDALLEQLADKGDGNYAYVNSYDEARRVMVEDLVSTMQVIALNAKIQVDFNPDVVARYRLIGYENRAVADSNFRNDAVDAGEIGAGHSATAIYAVQFRAGASGRIATIQLRWEDPDDHAVREINGNFNTWDLAPSYEDASPRYRLSVLVAQFAEVLRGSPWAYTGQLGMLSSYAYRLTEYLSDDPDVRGLAQLISIADSLTR